MSARLSIEDDGGIVTRYFTPKRAVYILTFVLFLNYVDRGIIAGAGTSIEGCVKSIEHCGKLRDETICVEDDRFPGHDEVVHIKADNLGYNSSVGSNSSVCTQCRICGDICFGEKVIQTGFGINTEKLGVLQSVFMVGYIIGAVLFAHLASKVMPFKLISAGLFLWICSAILSGLSGFLCTDHSGDGICDSYYLMVFARALSGVGEASLNTLTLPFLDDILEPGSKGFYIGIYYTAIPVGTAFGFMWAGMISQVTGGNWEWAFLLEAPVMIPFAILAYLVPFGYKSQTNIDDTDSVSGQPKKISLTTNMIACLSRPAFTLGCLGYAVYTGVVAGLGFYGPMFIQKYRPCDPRWNISQADADVIFGLIISSSGLLGTLIGGVMVDRIKSNALGRKNRNDLLKQLLTQLTLGFALSIGGIHILSPAVFFIFLFLGSTLIFMVSAGINLMLVWTVPKVNRPMAGALSVFTIHLLGDVPSPVLIGWISDNYSPLFTLNQTLLWLVVGIAFWSIILFLPTEVPQNVEDVDDEENVAIYARLSFEGDIPM
uniref:Major facilitator superfamily (MFS) profile domain-containing protein n=1 Tax=Mucochytrium quahogii TaxID=96639 RepID=A0A7S2W9R2_9STRA|mmetsp:Transcript_19669/g.32320  ORF Transcript_19669/g.32320 Transcript_19669/m.32320 type:complete len:544 (+) Transcript_19669:205-1836(+)